LYEERKVTTQEGSDLASSWNCKFFETSAKTCVNVENAFFEVVRMARNLEKDLKVKKKGCELL